MRLIPNIPSLCLALLLFAISSASAVYADEGMWVFNNLPLAHLKAKHGFVPPPGWAEHLRSAAVRFNNGGSGSFVSASGLIMTNHHIGADTLSKLGTKDHDYYRDGFFAHSYEEEAKAPDLELNVLIGIEDVTARVNQAVTIDMDDARSAEARRKAAAAIEKEATDKNGQRNDVVTLYQGGQYHLYTYKKYTDVRLVFAPEFDIAFFGGDPDNFEYPRYDLDICFFRAYEDGKPAKIEHYLKWSPAGAHAGDLVFVSGNPGGQTGSIRWPALSICATSSSRCDWTCSSCAKRFCWITAAKAPRRSASRKKSSLRFRTAARHASAGWRGCATRRSWRGRPRMRPSSNVRSRQVLARRVPPPGTRSPKRRSSRLGSPSLTSTTSASTHLISKLFDIARTLVRLGAKRRSRIPIASRNIENRRSKSLELELFSEAPIYAEFEQAKLGESLAQWKLRLPDDPLLDPVLRGRTPVEAARQLVAGSKLIEVPIRRRLAEGGLAAIEKSDDPMIKLAIIVDPASREVRKIHQDQVEGVEDASYAQIARANFELKGDAVYPDATFTLRLAFGLVAGYKLGSQSIPAFTTIGGAFLHASSHGDKPPYQLPKSWLDARSAGRLATRDPLQLRIHGRHHRRELRQPRGESRQ